MTAQSGRGRTRWEIGGVAEPGDDRELVLDPGPHRGGDPGAVTLGRPLAHRPLQPGQGGAAVGAGLVRIVETELVEGELDPAGNLQGRLDRLGTVPEQPDHLLRGLEPALGVLEKVETHLVDAPSGAKAGEHIGDGTPVRPVHEDRVGRNEGHPGRAGRACRPLFARVVRRLRQQPAKREPDLPGKGRAPRSEERGKLRGRPVGRQHDQRHPLRRGEEIAGAEPLVPGSVSGSAFGSAPALGFLPAPARSRASAANPSPRRPSLALGEEPGQPPVGGPVARIGKHGGSVREIEPRPGDRPEARHPRRRVDPHRPGERIVVRDAERLQAEIGRAPDQLLGMGGAPQEGVARDRLQLRVAGGLPPPEPARETGRGPRAEGTRSGGTASAAEDGCGVRITRVGSREEPVQEPARRAGMQIPVEPQARALLGLDPPVVAARGRPPRPRSPLLSRTTTRERSARVPGRLAGVPGGRSSRGERQEVRGGRRAPSPPRPAPDGQAAATASGSLRPPRSPRIQADPSEAVPSISPAFAAKGRRSREAERGGGRPHRSAELRGPKGAARRERSEGPAAPRMRWRGGTSQHRFGLRRGLRAMPGGRPEPDHVAGPEPGRETFPQSFPVRPGRGVERLRRPPPRDRGGSLRFPDRTPRVVPERGRATARGREAPRPARTSIRRGAAPGASKRSTRTIFHAPRSPWRSRTHSFSSKVAQSASTEAGSSRGSVPSQPTRNAGRGGTRPEGFGPAPARLEHPVETLDQPLAEPVGECRSGTAREIADAPQPDPAQPRRALVVEAKSLHRQRAHHVRGSDGEIRARETSEPARRIGSARHRGPSRPPALRENAAAIFQHGPLAAEEMGGPRHVDQKIVRSRRHPRSVPLDESCGDPHDLGFPFAVPRGREQRGAPRAGVTPSHAGPHPRGFRRLRDRRHHRAAVHDRGHRPPVIPIRSSQALRRQPGKPHAKHSPHRSTPPAIHAVSSGAPAGASNATGALPRAPARGPLPSRSPPNPFRPPRQRARSRVPRRTRPRAEAGGRARSALPRPSRPPPRRDPVHEARFPPPRAPPSR